MVNVSKDMETVRIKENARNPITAKEMKNTFCRGALSRLRKTIRVGR